MSPQALTTLTSADPRASLAPLHGARPEPDERDSRALELPRLHVLTDTRGGRNPMPDLRAVLAAARGRRQPVAIQVRAKNETDHALLALALAVVELVRDCGTDGTMVLVDDRVDIAVAAGADGVHLGAHDLPVHTARTLVGATVVVGGTARTPAAAHAAHESGATYLGVGPAFATDTKDGLPAPLGAAGVGAVTRSCPLPVIAIGGVDRRRVPELVHAGAHGVAVVTAVSGAADPQAATAGLLDALTLAAAG